MTRLYRRCAKLPWQSRDPSDPSDLSGVAAAALLDPAVVEGGFGVNTSGAVQSGSRMAIASCVAAIARRQPERVQVIATGRFAAEAVRQLMPEARVIEDLALQGLAHLLTEARS